jgi:hypothetical protein
MEGNNMAKHDECKCGGVHLFGDWFYIVLILLVAFVVLGVNLGFLGVYLFAYWPVLLIAAAIKELIERR